MLGAGGGVVASRRTFRSVVYKYFFFFFFQRARTDSVRPSAPTSTRARGSPARVPPRARPRIGERVGSACALFVWEGLVQFLAESGLAGGAFAVRAAAASLAFVAAFAFVTRAHRARFPALASCPSFDARVAHDGERRVRGRRADLGHVPERRRARDLAGGAHEHARAASGPAEGARDGGGPVHGRARTRREACDLRRKAGGAIGRWWRGWSARRAAVATRRLSEEAFAAIRPRAMSSSLPTRTREVLGANAKGLARGVVRRADRHRQVSGARKHRDEGHRAVRARATLCSAKRPARVEIYWLFVPPRKSHSRARAR